MPSLRTLARVGAAVAALIGPAAVLTVPFTTRAAAGQLPTVEPLTVQLWLRSANQTAAKRFAAAVSTPGNPMYRHFLSPKAYEARFGATQQETSAVERWLRVRGFSAVAADPQRDYVRATAAVTTVHAAFHTTLGQHPADAQATGGSPLDANHRPLSLPTTMAPYVLGVTGLEKGASSATPQQRPSPGRARGIGEQDQGPCSTLWGQRMLSGLPSKLGTTRFPETTCGYTPAQFRSAYGANMTNTGTGQTITFAEAGGLVPNMFTTLRDYARQFHLPAPAAARYKELNLQPSSCKKPQESTGEEQMDVESAYAMAPGATQLVVGANLCQTGNGGYEGGLDTDLAIINGNGQAPLASVVANSWETGYDDQAENLNRIETAILVKAAAVGVGMYYSAGDTPCVTQPASNPYATGVGGTILAVGRSRKRLFETGGAFGREFVKNNKWGATHYFGFAGGQSLVYKQPGYQNGVVPAAMSTPPARGRPAGQAACRDGARPPRPGTSPMRSAPDVSADAVDGIRVGLIRFGTYTTINDAGTSLSAPLVAGMVVAAQQGQDRPFGFINPALYTLAGTSAFYDPRPITSQDPLLWRAEVCPRFGANCGGVTALWLTDDESRSQQGYNGQITRKGYDTMTGVGVPHGQAFIAAMRKLTRPPGGS